MHPNSASADWRRVQVRRCTEFWPLPTGTPTPPDDFVYENSVFYHFFVPDPFAPLYLSVKYPFEP